MGLIIVSNRLPVTVQGDEVARSSGGLATGMRGPHECMGGVWIGWPGQTGPLDEAMRQRLRALGTEPVELSQQELDCYYEGYSNASLWPTFHYLLNRLAFKQMQWEAYVTVNQRFADAVVAQHRDGDIIWVHDYQLLLVPQMVRAKLPRARIGLFVHIPFPSSEVFRLIPQREHVLRGMLGADLIGFHTLDYAQHFRRSVERFLGETLEENRTGAFAMGIDAAHFAALASEVPQKQSDCLTILGVDRLDYTKGIRRRLMAYERLLPEMRGRVQLIQVAVPTRSHVSAYVSFQRRVHELIGRINGAHATPTWTPIHYIHRSLEERELAALYATADVMMVTPIRDGMNLVAKEFVASRTREDGVLVLSELAGAAHELTEALLVNPYDIEATAGALHRALAMPPAQQRERMRAMRARVLRDDVNRWAERFLAALQAR